MCGQEKLGGHLLGTKSFCLVSLTVCRILTFVAAEGEDGHHGGRSPFPCVCIFYNSGDKDGMVDHHSWRS